VSDVPVLKPREAVPFHPGRDVSPTLLRVIARDIGMNVRDLVAGR